MTKTILKKTLTLLMALCLLAGLLPVNVRAADVQVGTLAELQSALKTAKQQITLTSTISVTGDTELDLNGCIVTCLQDTVTVGLEVSGGVLTIKDSVGGGCLTGTADSKNLVAVRVMSGALVLESGTIKVSTTSSSASAANAILVPSEYTYQSAYPNAVCIYGGTVDVTSKENTIAISMSTSAKVGITVTDGTVAAHSRTGDYAYAIYLNTNPFLISGGKVSADSKSSSPKTYPYAIYRSASCNPRSDAEVRGAKTKIDGLVYIHDGVNKAASGITGGMYSAQLNLAYVHSGCKLHMHEDETDAPYYWWVTGETTGSYTISFNSNGGTGSMSSVTASVGEGRILPACTFTRVSHSFLGWSTSSGGAVQYNDKATVKDLAAAGGSVTLYAVWHKETYTVTWYDYSGNGVLETDEVEKNAKPVFGGQDPMMMGANFRGWATAPKQSQGKPVGELPAVTKDTAYYAAFSQFAPERCTVTWYDYTGKIRLDQSNVVYGSHAVYNGKQPTYEPVGYIHVEYRGWSTSPGQSTGAFVEDLPLVTDNASYYAAFHMEPISYTVAFEANGGDGRMWSQTFRYDETKALSANEFTKTGYHFLGWAETAKGPVKYADKATVKNLSSEQGAAVTLYAVWEIDRHTVTWYERNGREVLYQDTMAEYGSQPKFKGMLPTVLGGNFEGWATQPDQTSGTPEADLPAVTEDVNYYAAYKGWTPDYYTVTWMDYDGKTVLAVKSYVDNAAAVYPGETDPTRTRTGYTCAFQGWALTEGQSDGIDLPRVSEDATYYAAFVDSPNHYRVSFDYGDGTTSSKEQIFVYDEEQALEPRHYTKPGYHFICWTRTVDGKEYRYEDGEVVKNLTEEPDGLVILQAVWEINTYTVIWRRGNEILDTTYAKHGDKPTLNIKEEDIRSPYVGSIFIGWSTEPGQNTGTFAADLPPVTANTVYYAVFQGWTPDYYTVTWMDYDGKNVLDTETQVINSAVSYKGESPTRDRPGYTSAFRGWSAQPRQSAGTAVEQLPRLSADVTYYAAFVDTPNSYTVRFDANGGDAGSMAEQTFTYDTAQALRANAFTKTGWHFLGWADSAGAAAAAYADKAVVKNLSAEPDGSVTLYAVWAINTYTVTWCNDAYVIETDTEVPYDSAPVYNGSTPVSTRLGAQFRGWATQPGQTTGLPVPELPVVTDDVVYYAAFGGWHPDYYTVTWMDYEGRTILDFKSVVSGSHAIFGGDPNPPVLPEKTGYTQTFQGWADAERQSAGTAEGSLPQVMANVTYYAAFSVTPNSYTVSFSLNGGDAGNMDDQSFTYDEAQALTVNAFTKTGFHFLGWAETAAGPVKYADGETVKNLSAEPNGSVTLYAVWEINNYTVIWRTASEILYTQHVDHGGRPAYGGETPSVVGGNFAGWATAPNQTSGQPVPALPDVEADTVYYAAFSGWTPSYYTVTWMDYEGKTVLRTDTLVINSALVYRGAEPTRSRTGYTCTFEGWADAPRQSSGMELPRISDNVVCYAAFADAPNSYTVSFRLNGGDAGSMDDQSFTYDEAQALTANAFTKEGYHFLGWAETADGSVKYADRAVVRNLTAAADGSVPLYAVWEINTYTVTWCLGTEIWKITTAQHGSKPQNDEEPSLIGGKFKGWATQPGQKTGQPVSELPAVTDDIVYYAVFEGWSPSYYQITWMDHGGSSILYRSDLVYNAQPEYRGDPPERSRTGYDSQFTGWSDMPGQTEPLTEIPRVTDNAVYYAAFADTPITYTIAFDPGGGKGSMNSISATYDEFTTLPAVGFTGGEHEIFLGWALARGGEVRFADCAMVINLSAEQGATVTLYALWAPRATVTVFFDPNGGSCDTAEKTVYVGETYGALPTATRSDYSFNGWYTEAAAGTKVLADTVVEQAEAHTLFAHWTDNGGGGGGGGGSDEPGKPTTSMNPDGSVTETRIDRHTDPDGTVTTTSIETTRWPDGRKQEIKLVETERSTSNANGGTTTVYTRDDSTVNTLSDGSVNNYHRVYSTETTTSAHTDPDGTLNETTVVETKETLTQTETDTRGFVSGTETETTAREETKTATQRSADGSAAVTEEWSVDTRTIESEVGSGVKATVTERHAERSIRKTVSDHGAVSGSGSYSERGSSSGPAGESSFTAAGSVTVETDAKGSVLTVREGTRTTTAADGGKQTVRERLTDGVSALGTTASMEEIDGVLRSASAYLSDAAVEAARSEGTPVVIPLTVAPVDDPHGAVPIEVDLRVIESRRLDGHLNVSDMPLAEIGVTESGPGIIVFYLAGDGTPSPIRECREGSVIFPVNDYMQVVVAHNDKSFPDVSMSDWFGPSALFTAAREVLIGTGELFEPEIWMTRAMVAQLIYNYERDRRAEPDAFDDVEPGDWFADAVGWAGSVGYVKGDGVNFRPNDPITRQDLVTILYRYALDEGYNVSARTDLGRFPDAADVSDYALEALQWAVADGVILGMDDGTISPLTCATRAQVACIMQRFISTVKGAGTIKK